jgi:pilus assembly protein CpaB
MNWKTWIPLALAIVLGLVAAKVAKDVLSRDKHPVAQGNLRDIIITANALPPGHEIKAEDLVIGKVSPESAPERGFDSIAAVLGRTTKVEMVKGQAVVDTLLADTDAGSGLAALVPPGMRAITIEVNEFSGVAGMVIPGCRVDVVATIQATGSDEMVARTIVQNVKVTAIGQRVTKNPDPKEDQAGQQAFHSVTLLTTPDEAEAISLANTTGRPWLVLRSGKDEEKVNTVGVTLTSLRGKSGDSIRKADPFIPVSQPLPTTQPAKALEPIAMNTRTIQVIRGGTESTVTVTLPSMQDSAFTGGKQDQQELPELNK